LGLTYLAIEWKKYDADNNFDYALDVDDDLDEDIPITEQIKQPPPPPPPPAPEVIEIVKDEEIVEETVIESTETDHEEKIIEVDDVEVADDPIDVDVPFAVIEDKPMFQECKNEPKAQQFQCFKERLDQ